MGQHEVVSTVGAVMLIGPDKINDPTGKEIALSKSKVTRKKTYDVLYEGLSSVKVISDEDMLSGKITYREEPDYMVRHKYMETALKVFGDLKDKQEIEVSNKMPDSDRELLIRLGVREAIKVESK